MKQYKSLEDAKRSLVTQVLTLTAIAFLLLLTGRVMVSGRFPVSLVLSEDMSQVKATRNVTIRWQKEEMVISKKEVKEVVDPDSDLDEPEHVTREIRGGAMQRDQDTITKCWINGGKTVENWFRHLSTAGRQDVDDGDLTHVLQVTMIPEKAGKYVMKVFDPSGKELLKDEIFVGRFLTAFSKQTGRFTGDESVLLVGIFYFLGLMIIMLVFFRRLEGPLAYSYEAIFSCGVFILSLVALIIEIPVYVNHLRHPELYTAWQVICDIAAGGKYFMIFTAPLVIVFSVLLIFSNIELLQHERPRFQNVLGLLLGFILIAVEIFYYILYSGMIPVPEEQQFIVVSLENIIGIAFTYFECILFASLLCGYWAAKHVPSADRDYILILGCGFRKDGSLPPLLKGRVDKAMEFWYRQKEKYGKEAIVIPSGGQGQDEIMAESQAMYQYMVSTGFPERVIIREDKSANTYQNMEFSKSIIDRLSPVTPEGLPVKTAFVTTNYHVFRSGVWAGRAGLPAEGLGSRTKWWYWPNAFIRECVGLFSNCLVPELLGLGFLILFFVIITWLSYL